MMGSNPLMGLLPMSPVTLSTPFLGPEYRTASARILPMTTDQQAVREAILTEDHPGDYEPVACLCGEQAEGPVVSEVDRYGLPYRKVLCPQCGLLRVNPRWTESRYARFYEAQYRPLYNPVGQSVEDHVRLCHSADWTQQIGAWVMDAYHRFGTGRATPKIVEIGAGGGWNLGTLPAAWQRIGYDVDNAFLAAGRHVFGVEMKHGFDREARADLDNADMVLLSHVVEHFLDPVPTVAALTAALPPTALMLIEVPGIFRLHRTRRDPMVYWQNAHIYTFCAETLQALCEAAGLEVLQLDETCRVVCRRAVAPSPARRHGRLLKARILAYLALCQWGITVFRKPRRKAKSLFSRLESTYFRAVGWLVPPAKPSRSR